MSIAHDVADFLVLNIPALIPGKNLRVAEQVQPDVDDKEPLMVVLTPVPGYSQQNQVGSKKRMERPQVLVRVRALARDQSSGQAVAEEIAQVMSRSFSPAWSECRIEGSGLFTWGQDKDGWSYWSCRCTLYTCIEPLPVYYGNAAIPAVLDSAFALSLGVLEDRTRPAALMGTQSVPDYFWFIQPSSWRTADLFSGASSPLVAVPTTSHGQLSIVVNGRSVQYNALRTVASNMGTPYLRVK